MFVIVWSAARREKEGCGRVQRGGHGGQGLSAHRTVGHEGACALEAREGGGAPSMMGLTPAGAALARVDRVPGHGAGARELCRQPRWASLWRRESDEESGGGAAKMTAYRGRQRTLMEAPAGDWGGRPHRDQRAATQCDTPETEHRGRRPQQRSAERRHRPRSSSRSITLLARAAMVPSTGLKSWRRADRRGGTPERAVSHQGFTLGAMVVS